MGKKEPKEPKQVSIERLLAGHAQLSEADPLRYELVRCAPTGDVEVTPKEVKSTPGRYELRDTKDADTSGSTVVCFSDSLDARAGNELTRESALAREIQRSGDRLLLGAEFQQRSLEWYDARFRRDVDEMDRLRRELAEKDKQIAELIADKSEFGEEFMKFASEGLKIWQSYSFSDELKRRLNAIAKLLTPAEALRLQELMQSQEWAQSKPALFAVTGGAGEKG